MKFFYFGVLLLLFPLIMKGQLDNMHNVLMPSEQTQAFALNNNEVSLFGTAYSNAFGDESGFYVNPGFVFSVNPKDSVNLTYSLTHYSQSTLLNRVSETGLTFQYDFLRKRDRELSAGISLCVWSEKLFEDNLVYFGNPIWYDTSHIYVSDFYQVESRNLANFHTNLVYRTKSIYLRASIFNITTPNVGEIAYGEMPVEYLFRGMYSFSRSNMRFALSLSYFGRLDRLGYFEYTTNCESGRIRVAASILSNKAVKMLAGYKFGRFRACIYSLQRFNPIDNDYFFERMGVSLLYF